MSQPSVYYGIIKSEIRIESDIVTVRQRVREIAKFLGFDSQDQTRIATSVSEIARNAFQYAKGGMCEIAIESEGDKQRLIVTVTDRGTGIQALDAIMGGTYVSQTGMGLGITGSRRLMDRVNIDTSATGTAIRLEKFFPIAAKKITPKEIASLSLQLAHKTARSPSEELQIQNRELIESLDIIHSKNAELGELNRELENTNRGVVALYAELDEKATILKRISETKSGFLANMTHEFRTPINSILNISNLLIDPTDGVTDPQHLKQVGFIRKSAADLSDLINDLLDLSKVEAGKIELRPSTFSIEDVFGTLRGLMRPLLEDHHSIDLIFENEVPEQVIYTDEGKLNQILRNLISNAIKYTEKGEVRVRAWSHKNELYFSVQDTGIGIASEDRDRIFEEFVQIHSPLQSKVKGTGLGLPLTARLIKLLNGSLELKSEVGKGSEFTICLPMRYEGPQQGDYIQQAPLFQKTQAAHTTETSQPIALLIDDDESYRYALATALEKLGIKSVQARDGNAALDILAKTKPQIIFLDLIMPGRNGFEVLKDFMANPAWRSLPVVIYSNHELSDEQRTYLNDVTLGVLDKGAQVVEQNLQPFLKKAGFKI